jgi:hypothetical protein
VPLATGIAREAMDIQSGTRTPRRPSPIALHPVPSGDTA